MVDALVSGASAERRVGSSPIMGTSKGVFFGKFLFCLPRIGLVQSVAVWHSCLRLSSVQSCFATLEYRLRNICSNKFGIYFQPIFQTFGFLHILSACNAQTCDDRSSLLRGEGRGR